MGAGITIVSEAQYPYLEASTRVTIQRRATPDVGIPVSFLLLLKLHRHGCAAWPVPSLIRVPE